MKQLVNTLFLLFIFHVLISLAFIFFPSFLKETRFAKIYKTYLLPGPFFRDDKITTTYNYLLLWKQGGQWSAPINPARDYFDQYHKNLNPSNLYISRYIRSVDQMLFFRGLSRGKAKQFSSMSSFVFDQNIPEDADSIRLIASKKLVIGFTVKVDLLITPDK